MEMCSDGSYVEGLWNYVLVITTSFLVSSVGVSTCGLLGWNVVGSIPDGVTLIFY
jgi:hypothetical protein